jgi:hypothetical protein
MPKIKAAWLLSACLGVLSQASIAQQVEVSKGFASSIRTIDQLLKAENDALIAKSLREAPPATPKPVKGVKPSKPEPRRIPVTVQSIFGAGEAMFARMSVDGITHQAVTVGSRLGPCVVKGISNQTVQFETDDPTQTVLCPSNSVWRGDVDPMAIQGQSPTGTVPQPSLGQGVPVGQVGTQIPLPVQFPGAMRTNGPSAVAPQR